MATERVVLVHGLWMRGFTMALLGRRLARAGFAPTYFSYSSVTGHLDANAAALGEFVARLGAPVVHFVGHSLGGLVTLALLARAAGLPPGRTVLLGSPVTGSVIADRLGALPGGKLFLGRAVPEWHAAPRPTHYPGREIGSIAGTLAFGAGKLLALGLPPPHDGAVTVAETRFPGMQDHVTLPVSHSGLLLARSVARHTAAFLRTGRFEERGIT